MKYLITYRYSILNVLRFLGTNVSGSYVSTYLLFYKKYLQDNKIVGTYYIPIIAAIPYRYLLLISND